MEPSHSSLSDTPLRKAHSNSSDKSSGGRWGNVKEDTQRNQHDIHEEGCILLLEDKSGMFNKRKGGKGSNGSGAKSDEEGDGSELESSLYAHLPYKNGALAIHGKGSTNSMDESTNPRRGDLVSFVKAKSGKGVRDIRVVNRQEASLLRGRLENIERSEEHGGKAKFIAATAKEEVYEINLSEVISCDLALLKEKQAVEGILYKNKIYGVCRTTDLYLESKLGASHKERPKLNLAVKKDRGGTIIAQSMMAKGPDGSNGFAKGWTKRTSRYKR